MAEDQFGSSVNIDNPDDFKVFNAWKQALENSLGYENTETIEDYKKQIASSKPWERVRSVKLTEREFQLIGLFSICIGDKKHIRVIDLGGGNGYMCHLLREWFPLVEIDYTIWESPSMSNAYKEFENHSKIAWISEKPIESFDLAITSCTLQYLEFPEKYLQDLSSLCDKLIILRFPELLNQEAKFAVQKTYKIDQSMGINTWPIKFFGRGELDGMIPSNFKKVLEFFHHDETYLFDGEKVILKGFYFSII